MSKIPQEVLDDLRNDEDFLSLPDSDQNEYLDKIASKFGETPNAGNILQRVAKAATSMFQPPQAMDVNHPFQSGINSTMQGLKQVPGLGGYMAGQEAKTGAINNALPNNPIAAGATDILTDPDVIGGAGLLKSGIKNIGKSSVGKNIGRMFSDDKALKFSNELEGMVEKSGSSLSRRMGAGMDAAQEVRDPGLRVSFMDDITKPQMSSKVSKLINKSDNLKLYDLDNLSLKESQDVINTLKSDLRQSLKTGDIVKSDEREILRFIDELKTKQLDTFPEHKYVLENYGEGIEAYKNVSGDVPRMMESKGMNRIERAAQEQSLRKASPEAFKKYKGYKNTKRVVKGAGYATGLAGAAGLGKKIGLY